MSRVSQIEKLIVVKQALMEKYDRLAQARNSVPGRSHMTRKAEHYRKQVATLKLLAR
ncbi:MAG: hypothetical protein O3C60_02685 [Planctomycetota bacterium]|nr:hypothetical protein [Planctomycetota bacterium]